MSQFSAPKDLLLPNGEEAISAWNLTPELFHANHGSFGAVPKSSLKLQAQYKEEMERSPVVWFSTLTEKVKAERGRIAEIIGVSDKNLAIVPNASGGASCIYNSLYIARDTEILVTNHGYGAVNMGALRAAKKAGARLVTANIPISASAEEAASIVIENITNKTQLVVIDQITSATARFMPVDDIISACRMRGVPVLVDAAHVPGLVETPLPKIMPDFWIANLHKFACSPRGVAVLVTDGGVHTQSLYPVVDSWGYPDSFPDRFDIQGTLDMTAVFAAVNSWNFIEDTWGWANVREFMKSQADYATQIICDSFTRLTGEDHSENVGQEVNALRLIKLPGKLASTHELASILRLRAANELKLSAAFTNFDDKGYLRISTHAYTRSRDWEYLAEECVPKLFHWAKEL